MNKVSISITLVILFFALLIPVTINSIHFKINCGDRMSRASNSNSIELATIEMDAIVSYLENNNLTKGYTSVFIKTPDEDLNFFYNNMKSSLSELKSIPPNSSPLEKSNVLMKLRESLNNYPDGLAFYPYNFLIGLFTILSILIFCFIFFFIALYEE